VLEPKFFKLWNIFLSKSNTYKLCTMTPFFGEMVGTGLVVFFGQTVVSNVVLAKTKGHNSGWIVISFGWAMAVFIGVFCSASSSKAHLNPVVTIAFAALGKIPLSLVPIYLSAQFLGAIIGSTVAWLCFRGHFGPDAGCGCSSLPCFAQRRLSAGLGTTS
jgi:glycerol uptake facilitator protein